MKILDFGVAKILASPDGSQSVKTRTGSLMGTPLYMSPEQCKGAGVLDHRTDIYSLGVMLFEMLAGRPPFIAEGVGELFAKHMLEDPPHVLEFAPNTPPAHGGGDHEVAGQGAGRALREHGGLPQGAGRRGQGDRAAPAAAAMPGSRRARPTRWRRRCPRRRSRRRCRRRPRRSTIELKPTRGKTGLVVGGASRRVAVGVGLRHASSRPASPRPPAAGRAVATTPRRVAPPPPPPPGQDDGHHPLRGRPARRARVPQEGRQGPGRRSRSRCSSPRTRSRTGDSTGVRATACPATTTSR